MAILHKFFLHYFLRTRAVPPSPVYQLGEQTLIGAGSARECHIHPTQGNHCIKTPAPYNGKELGDESIIEQYISRQLDKHNVSTRHRAQCHGWVQTNLGIGLVTDRIQGSDGQQAPTLSHFIRHQKPTEEQIMALFAELKAWIFKNCIPISDFHPENVLVRDSTTDPHLVLIDGIGRAKFRLKLISYSVWPRYARWRTSKHWPVLEENFLSDCKLDEPPSS